MQIEIIPFLSCSISCLVGWYCGYSYGQKNTNIYHTNNYTGEIEKLVINGEVRWSAPQKSAEANPPHLTTQQGSEPLREISALLDKSSIAIYNDTVAIVMDKSNYDSVQKLLPC